eukprot:TRINITY_DN28713_c0_g2_i1.p2 TRINITY_DN28713_c0_g2~~TRINITY_DN28713_c0_g2_i1.p2  ORF type:complete len:192 (-),score=25.41 TRINITY_DN28713_c0_g2_i1:315-890(-)
MIDHLPRRRLRATVRGVLAVCLTVVVLRPASRCSPPLLQQGEKSSTAGDAQAHDEDHTVKVADGCGHRIPVGNSILEEGEPLAKYYEKQGLWGSMAGALGDRKTLYCHHVTQEGMLAVRSCADDVDSLEEAWATLRKDKPCRGRYCYDRASKSLVCSGLAHSDHDCTCNEETCIFLKNRLPCPVPEWALKD